MQSLYSPLRSENQAMDLPSGDQAGERSLAPGELVRLRSSPFSRGSVKISPRYSNAARAPDGETDVWRMYFFPFMKRGSVSTRAAATPRLVRPSLPLVASRRLME